MRVGCVEFHGWFEVAETNINFKLVRFLQSAPEGENFVYCVQFFNGFFNGY